LSAGRRRRKAECAVGLRVECGEKAGIGIIIFSALKLCECIFFVCLWGWGRLWWQTRPCSQVILMTRKANRAAIWMAMV
jgi:hypothetical protein